MQYIITSIISVTLKLYYSMVLKIAADDQMDG